MATGVLTWAVVGGSLVLISSEAEQSGDEPPKPADSGASQIRQTLTSLNPAARAASLGGTAGAVHPISQSSPDTWPSDNGEFPQEVIDEMIAQMVAQLESLSLDDAAKLCEAFKRRYPEEPSIQGIDCPPTFLELEQAVKAMEALQEAQQGGYLKVIAEDYFGIDFEGWADSAWNKVEGWAKDAWDYVNPF